MSVEQLKPDATEVEVLKMPRGKPVRITEAARRDMPGVYAALCRDALSREVNKKKTPAQSEKPEKNQPQDKGAKQP